jgi:endonuclease III-like uncharacterized protein
MFIDLSPKLIKISQVRKNVKCSGFYKTGATNKSSKFTKALNNFKNLSDKYLHCLIKQQYKDINPKIINKGWHY